MHRVGFLLITTIAVIFGSSCGSTSEEDVAESPPASISQSASTTSLATTSEEVDDSNEALQGDSTDDQAAAEAAAFWAQRWPSGALDVEGYDSLKEMAEQSDAVVLGVPVAVADTAKVQGENEPGTPEDIVAYTTMEFEVVDPLRFNSGEKAETVRISFVGGFDEREMSKEPVVLFLRSIDEEAKALGLAPDEVPAHQRGAYRVVSRQGFFIKGPDGAAVNPVVEAEADEDGEIHDPVAKEARSISLDQLIDQVRVPG